MNCGEASPDMASAACLSWMSLLQALRTQLVVLLRRAQQMAPPLLFRLTSFLLWPHLLLRVASRAGGEPDLAPMGKSMAGMNPSCLTLLLS